MLNLLTDTNHSPSVRHGDFTAGLVHRPGDSSDHPEAYINELPQHILSFYLALRFYSCATRTKNADEQCYQDWLDVFLHLIKNI